MADFKTLLFEIGCEELPPNSLMKLSHALKEGIIKGLEKAELDFGESDVYATPRRLAVLIKDISTSQVDKKMEKKGPSVQAAFTEGGLPSKAAEGFARSCGTSVDKLARVKTSKGEWLVFNQQMKGQATSSLLPDIIRQSINDLPIAKRMRWGMGEVEFVRPVHWIVLLFGDQLLDTTILGINTGKHTQGHRFLSLNKITINSPDEYVDKLYEPGKVIVDFKRRKQLIRDSAEKKVAEISGRVLIEDNLLEEVTALNEWPVPILGSFDEEYLRLPSEVLITTMQKNQKYFPVVDAANSLLPYFITISNITSKCEASIKKGNERVIKPRLADAKFFWDQDRKRSLQDRLTDLSKIVFQQKLGTLAEKTHRITQVTDHICLQLNVDSIDANRAAMLSKTDLVTEMVGEFPNLQGIMGRYYAQEDGENESVALALEEQYYPRQSGGATPSSICGQVLSIAEKMDTLTGIFSAGLIPTGEKDPYGLRRSALSILRIMIENQVDLDVFDLIDFSLEQFNHDFQRKETHDRVIDFVYDRLKGYCLERGYQADEYAAVVSIKPQRPLDFMRRLEAVREFRLLSDAEGLTSANKRIRNILRKTEIRPDGNFNHLPEHEEQNLLQAAQKAGEKVQPMLAKQDYRSALHSLAELRTSIDAFFDNVMVMTDDVELCANRLGLLAMLEKQFLQIADISKLQS